MTFLMSIIISRQHSHRGGWAGLWRPSQRPIYSLTNQAEVRMRVRLPVVTFIIGVVVAGSDAFAHHSFAPHFDASKPVSIAGTLTQFEAKNPHSYVHINAVDENGRTHEYVCESHGVTQLTRNGITPQLLKAG